MVKPTKQVLSLKSRQWISIQTFFWKDRQRIFLDTAGFGEPEERDPVSHSLFNQTEADIVFEVLQKLLNLGVQQYQFLLLYPTEHR